MPCKGCWGELYAHWTYSCGIDNGGKTFSVMDGLMAVRPRCSACATLCLEGSVGREAQAIPVEWQWKESKNDVDCYEIG